MSKSIYRGSLLATTMIAGLAFATPAFAQEVPAGTTAQTEPGVLPQEAVPAAEDEAGDIVVTGTLIKNPNLVSSSPVAVIGQEEINLRQTGSAEQLLREVPGASPNLGQNVNNGTVGSSRVDLRSLNSNRNIVLLDSRRLVPSSSFGVVDLNNIPLALIDRVDVLTGGASTTYGADAVSGVVNFITKKNFAGVDLSVGEQISERGDTNKFRADLTIGANFDDGRGNAVLSVGYQEADPLYFGARDSATFTISSVTGKASGDSFTSTPTAFSFATADLQVSPDGSQLVDFYNFFNFNPFNVYVTPFQRFNFYGAGNYEVSDVVEVYARGMFSKNTSSGIIAPSGIFGTKQVISSSNPFLNPVIRDQLCAANGLPTGAACAANTAIPLPVVYRRTVELGPRISEYVSNVFDFVAGIRVSPTENITFDLYGSYGESANVETRKGYVSNSRVAQALNATNTTTCVNTANACVPLNLFGPITPAMGAFIGGITSSITNASSLAQVHGVVSGDLGFTTPWAAEPIGFAVGAEYRSYGAQRRPDNLASVPGELGGAGGAVLPLDGGFDVQEGFAEIIAPIISDRPFFNELTLEAGVRHSKYNVDAEGNPRFQATTYKLGANWEPVEGIKFRGNYQRAVRAPNIGELFAPVVTGLTNLLIDPCAGAAPRTNANLAAICIAQGAPAASIGFIQNPSAGQANATGGGNPNILPETATTYTVGVVLQPRDFVRGLTVTVDYYNIKVVDAITTATPDDTIFACFGSITAASATSDACTSIRRNQGNGRLSGTSTPTNPIPGLPAPLTNSGKIFTDGIDLNINYVTDLNFAKLNMSFNGNYTFNSEFQASPTGITRECVGYYSVNCSFTGSLQPKFQWNQRTTLSFAHTDVSLLWRHMDAMRYEPGLPPLFSGTITGRGALVGRVINFNRIKAYDYFDLSTRFSVTDNFDLTLTAFNLLDKDPPIVGSSAGATTFNGGNTYPSTYDTVGRRYAATVRLKY